MIKVKFETTDMAARAGYLIGLLDHAASGMGGVINCMAVQRCKAPLIKTDSADRLQATIQGIFSHKCYKKD